LTTLYSIVTSIIIGCIFIYLFKFTYDLLYGEKKEKQIKKIHKYFRNETIKDIKLTEHEPRKFTRYTIVTSNGTQKIKMKPGYKVVKMVAPKVADTKLAKQKKR
jgi:hypothetical protein